MELNNSRILITGGAGFIGSHLAERLLKIPGVKVTVLDNLHNGREDNLQFALKNKNFTFVRGDILNKKLLDDCVKNKDYIFHLAVANLRESINSPHLAHSVNALGTMLVCEASLKNKIRKLIHFSSSEVYGTAVSVPMNEDHPKNPRTVYAAAKLAGDAYVNSFYRSYGLPAVIVRPFNTYGPREHMCGFSGEFIPRATSFILANKPVPIFGTGKQTRDFSYVTDIVEGSIRISETDKLFGREVNIAHGEEISLLEIIEILEELLNKKARIKFIEARPGDVQRHRGDIARLQKYCKWRPKINLKAGLKMYLTWLRAAPHNNILREDIPDCPIRNWI